MTTFAGNPITLVGKQLTIGDKAPSFTALNNELKEVSLNDFNYNVTVISVVPSLDTGVCDHQTRRINEELTNKRGVGVITISNDLPFAQSRWCGAAGLNDVIILSDYRDLDFGNKYGTLIKEFRLQTRAVFILDKDHNIIYSEYLDEITHHPNYDHIIKKVNEII